MALGKNKLLSNLLISFIASVPTLFILCYVYGIFKATGSNPMFGGLASAATAVYALPGFIFVAILICRLLYQHTAIPTLAASSAAFLQLSASGASARFACTPPEHSTLALFWSTH